MRVQADSVRFGKLARGLLHRTQDDLDTDVEVMGDVAISNAVKALGLANAFAEKETPPSLGVCFVPSFMESYGSEPLRKLSFSILRRPSSLRSDCQDFSRGGVYVPTAQHCAFSPRSREAVERAGGPRGTRGRAMAEAYLPLRADTPTELARVVMKHWLRFSATANTEAPKRAPFLLTRGPPALARAVRALAIACQDSRKEHNAARGVLPLAVDPILWEQPRRLEADVPDARPRFVVLLFVKSTCFDSGRGAVHNVR